MEAAGLAEEEEEEEEEEEDFVEVETSSGELLWKTTDCC